MNDYPLSTKSSKKNTSRPNPSQSRSPLLQRSVCQAPQPQLLRKQVYGHILQGEYVFIEIYEQGRVAQTPYPEYIAFMGGLVCKRLTSKVSIFLTNLTARELGPIKQRVGRICPNCRIVSILWFQRCYQVKNKVPFDQFALDTDEEIQDDYSKQSTQEVDLGTFLSNIGEDAENDFKDFFKNEKKKFFQYLPKSHTRPIEEIFQAKPYDLGPNPEKKVKTKNPNPRKRASRVSGKRLQNKEKKQVEYKKENEKENEGEQEKKQEQTEEDRPLVIESVVSKYLKMQEYIAEENQQVNNNSVPEKSQTTPVTSESQEPRPKPPSATQPIIPESYSKKSVQSALLGLKQKKQRQTQRFTFSKTGTLYKDITNKQENSIDKLELEGSLAVLRRADPNILPVIVASTAMEQKARQVNSQATHPSSLTFHILKYGLFSTISQRLPSSADIFFLINPKKPAERALFYALTIQKSALRVRLANYRLIEEVIAYNRQVKNAQSRTPIKLDRSLLRFTKQLVFEVCEQGVKGKRIVFLMSQLPWRVQQHAIQAMGGVYVHKDDYLSTTVDIIITERNFLLQARQAEAIPQEAFWKQVIRLQGQQ